MLISQNGFSANDITQTAVYTVPGTNVKVRLRKGDVATVLLYVAKRFHEEVEPLVTPGCWGYAERNIRGSSSTLSNHASGTAIDLNAPLHPLGTDPVKNFTPAQIAAIKNILTQCGTVVRWGGNYTGRKDPMHFEINAPARDVAILAAAIKRGFAVVISRTLKKGMSGEDVKAVQRRINQYIKNGKLKGVTKPLVLDGDYGRATYDAVKAFKKSRNFLGLAKDGNAGKGTITALGGIVVWGGQ